MLRGGAAGGGAGTQQPPAPASPPGWSPSVPLSSAAHSALAGSAFSPMSLAPQRGQRDPRPGSRTDTSFVISYPQMLLVLRESASGCTPRGQERRAGGLAFLCPSLTLASVWKQQGVWRTFLRLFVRDSVQDIQTRQQIREPSCQGSQLKPLPGATSAQTQAEPGPNSLLVFKRAWLTFSNLRSLEPRRGDTVILNRITMVSGEHF